jgi:hypothetical protein
LIQKWFWWSQGEDRFAPPKSREINKFSMLVVGVCVAGLCDRARPLFAVPHALKRVQMSANFTQHLHRGTNGRRAAPLVLQSIVQINRTIS